MGHAPDPRADQQAVLTARSCHLFPTCRLLEATNGCSRPLVQPPPPDPRTPFTHPSTDPLHPSLHGPPPPILHGVMPPTKKTRHSYPTPPWVLWLRDAGHASEHDRRRAETVARSGAFEDRTNEIRSLLRVAEKLYGKGVAKASRQPGADPGQLAARAGAARPASAAVGGAADASSASAGARGGGIQTPPRAGAADAIEAPAGAGGGSAAAGPAASNVGRESPPPLPLSSNSPPPPPPPPPVGPDRPSLVPPPPPCRPRANDRAILAAVEAGLLSRPPSPPPSLPPSPPPPLPPSPPPGPVAARPLLVLRPFSDEDTAQARRICPSVARPDVLVRYARDLPVSCPGGTFAWADWKNPVVVSAAMRAVMGAGNLRHHMQADNVNCCSKTSFVLGMIPDAPASARSFVTAAWLAAFPTFKLWLEEGLAGLSSCRGAQHDKAIMCSQCDAFAGLRARQLAEKFVALHRAGPRLWGEAEYQAVLSATCGAPSHISKMRDVMQAPPYNWVYCTTHGAASPRTVDHPPDDNCASCPTWRKYLCVCGAKVPSQVPSSVTIAGDLSALSGLDTIFCSTLCVRNTYVPSTVFPQLRLWLQDRDGRSRWVRAADLFGGIAADDDPLVDRLLTAHGQHGAPPPFPAHWELVEVTEEAFGRDNAARAAARARALFMRRSDPAGSTTPLDSVVPAFGNWSRQAAVNRQFKNAMRGVTNIGEAVRATSVVAWSDPSLQPRNAAHRQYPPLRRAVIPVIQTWSARAVEPTGDDDHAEDVAAEAAAMGEEAALASWGADPSVVESFYDSTVFSTKGEFDAWLDTGEDLWVYTTTRREDMLFVLKHGIHAIFTILSAAAGRPGGSASFHLRPLTSWSMLMRAAKFGFSKMDTWGGEGDVYLILMKETPDSALRRAETYMHMVYKFNQSCTTDDRRAAALCIPYEWAAGRYIRVDYYDKAYPWVEVVVPSPALWTRGATDCFYPELINQEQAGRLIGQVWDLQSQFLVNRLVFPAGVVRARRGTGRRDKRVRGTV